MPRGSAPRPADSTSRSSSSSSLPQLPLDPNDDDDGDAYSSDTSASSLRARSRSPVPPPKSLHQPTDFLAPPSNAATRAWRTISRSPSPLGLIPIHRKFSKTIHKYEVPRKLLHVSIGFVVVYLYRNGYQPVNIVPPLAAALVPIASADLLRYYSQPFNAFYIKLLGALMRESEVRRQNGVAWTGVVWYLVGTITVLAVFPKDVATLSILLLSWCDTAASTFGRAWGSYTPRIRKGKSVAGSLGAFVVGALAAGVFWGFVVPSTPRWPDDPVNPVMWREKLGIPFVGELTGGWALTVMSLLTGAVASVSEMLDAWGLDDNVVIPVVSAASVWGLLKVFG